MSTKIFNDQIISQSQLQSFQDEDKQIINPYEIKYTQKQSMIIPLFITKQQEQSKTITTLSIEKNNPSFKKSSHAIISQQKLQHHYYQQQTLNKKVCIPLIPITFGDLINYSQKCEQIRSLITYHTQTDFIKWIQQNNQQNCNLKINCNLLYLIKSQSFWKNIIIKMLNDILDYSEDIGNGNLLFFNQKVYKKIKQKNQKNYYSLNRFYCYILLCQMFFGLIPIQYHLIKHNNLCTFAYYMQMRENNFTCKQYQQQEYELTQQQQQKMHKLKSLIFYFSIMSQTQNQKKIQKQNIKLEYSKFQFQSNILYDPKNYDHQYKNYDHQQDYGKVGDQLLCQNIIIQPTNICHQNNDKLNQQNKFNSDQYEKSIKPIYFVQNIIDEMNNLKNNKFIKLVFEHPQIFVLKLICNQQIKQDQIIVISNLKKFSVCSHQQGKFTTLGRSDVQTLKVSETKQSNRKVFVKSRQNSNNQSLPNYKFNDLKNKLQNYVSILKPAIKTYYKKTIQIDFKQFLSLFQYSQQITISNDKNIYQEFMLIWIALSYLNMASCKIKLKIQNISKQVLYNINKIYSELSQRQIADCLSIICNYEKRPKKPAKIKRFKINLSKNQKPQYLSFIQYLKKYAF